MDIDSNTNSLDQHTDDGRYDDAEGLRGSDCPHATSANLGIACQACHKAAFWHFRPRKGNPLIINCSWGIPSRLECENCGKEERCEPMPALLQFDAIRFEELLDWSRIFFCAQIGEDGEIAKDERGNTIYNRPKALRVKLAQAQYRFAATYYQLVDAHETEHGLNARSSANEYHDERYESLIHQRSIVRRQQFRPPALHASEQIREAYARAICLRLERRDLGYGAWSAAVRRFVSEIKEAYLEAGMKEDYEEARSELPNEDVLDFSI
ncbi:hypothetical protein GGS21DRAFT_119121 [Xylaria nigripes]|nr:hypothetical protein GGS21DRAFT_119121 [Xylaria nigripes]